MDCISCGHEMGPVEYKTVEYRSLPGTWLVGIEVQTCPDCGEVEIGIPHMNELNELLAHHVAGRAGRLTGPEIRFLRKHLGRRLPQGVRRHHCCR